MYTSLNYGKIVYILKQFSAKHCYKLYFITEWYCLCVLILHNFYHFYLLSRKYWCNYFWTAYLYGNFCCPFTQSCLTLCNPMNCSTPGFPVLHHLPEFAQTHFHWVSDAIQPFHLLPPPSLPPLNVSQHQSLFQWVSSSYRVAKVLEIQLQHQSFQWTFRVDLL